MKVVPNTLETRFEAFLTSIGGLKNGYFTDKPPITSNICECGNGWLPMIQKCIEELIAIGWNKEIIQIKEKFGGLRFYTNGLTEEGHAIVQKYEELSYRICELCGSQENVNVSTQGWIRTLCNKCSK